MIVIYLDLWSDTSLDTGLSLVKLSNCLQLYFAGAKYMYDAAKEHVRAQCTKFAICSMSHTHQSHAFSLI